MRNRKNLGLLLTLAVLIAGGVTSWTLASAKSKPTNINQRYLQAFFTRYVAALNSNNANTCSATTAFYSPEAISVGAWGIELNNPAREAYFCSCKQAFPNAVVAIKSITIEPTSETNGRITWEFGIRAGKQVKPFLGVMSKSGGLTSTPDDSLAFDHEGLSIAEVEAFDNGSSAAIKSIEQQLASLDKEMLSVDERDSTRRSALLAKQAQLDQQLVDLMVGTIKITRQTSFQNMDAFLKKLNGE